MFRIATALLLLPLSLTAQAQSLQPHVHGAAQLQVVLEQQTLQISLNSPGANLLGFEHAPQTPAEKTAQAQLEERMRDPAVIIRLPAAADCMLSQVEMRAHYEHQVGGMPADHDHEHEHDHEQEEPNEHSDLSFDYRFICASPEALKTAELSVFESFPGLQTLRAEVIGETQSLQELSAANPVLKF